MIFIVKKDLTKGEKLRNRGIARHNFNLIICNDGDYEIKEREGKSYLNYGRGEIGEIALTLNSLEDFVGKEVTFVDHSDCSRYRYYDGAIKEVCGNDLKFLGNYRGIDIRTETLNVSTYGAEWWLKDLN